MKYDKLDEKVRFRLVIDKNKYTIKTTTYFLSPKQYDIFRQLTI